jgi:hypothetical protein
MCGMKPVMTGFLFSTEKPHFHRGGGIQTRVHPYAGLHWRAGDCRPRGDPRWHCAPRWKPETINPLVAVDLVIDHSVTVDFYTRNDALFKNVDAEFVRSDERYAFLRWGQHAFDNFRVVPPARESAIKSISSIAQVVWTSDAGSRSFAYPDTLFGTDSRSC